MELVKLSSNYNVESTGSTGLKASGSLNILADQKIQNLRLSYLLDGIMVGETVYNEYDNNSNCNYSVIQEDQKDNMLNLMDQIISDIKAQSVKI